MPSENQRGTRKEFKNKIDRHLREKNEATIAALIRGMEDKERVQEWIETEAEGQARAEVIGRLNRRKMELEDSD